MPSDLGQLIRDRRTEKGVGLRELARRINKSPAFQTQLECDEVAPPVAEDTLRAIASELDLDADELLVLASRTPRDLIPQSVLDVALFRKVKGLTEDEKRRMLNDWSSRGRPER
jgi:transcriptional regulator with XRE-family HTH domain